MYNVQIQYLDEQTKVAFDLMITLQITGKYATFIKNVYILRK